MAANYNEVMDTTEELFDTVINNTTLSQHLTIRIIGCDYIKENGNQVIGNVKTVTGANKFLSINKSYPTGVDVVIYLNEDVFEMLDDNQRRIVADELVAWISYNPEKDSIKINKPNINVHAGILTKYGKDEVLNTYEIIRETFASIEMEA